MIMMMMIKVYCLSHYHCHVSSTAQILSHDDLLFYVILMVIILANVISKLLEDGAGAPNHEGSFVM